MQHAPMHTVVQHAPGGPLRAREPQRADSAAAVCRGSRATVRLYAASRQATVLSGPHARTHLHAQYTPQQTVRSAVAHRCNARVKRCDRRRTAVFRHSCAREALMMMPRKSPREYPGAWQVRHERPGRVCRRANLAVSVFGPRGCPQCDIEASAGHWSSARGVGVTDPRGHRLMTRGLGRGSGCAPDGPGRSGVSLSESLRWRTVRNRGEEAILTTRMDPLANGARPPLRDETAAPSKNWSCYQQ